MLMGETVAWVSGRARRGEHRLRTREKRFRALVGTAADIITVVDDAGVITYESPPVTEVLGYLPSETVGTAAGDRIHPDDLATMASVTAELRDHPGSVVRIELRLRHADGTWPWCSTPIPNP